MLEGLLASIGHTVVCVDNGQQALDVFAEVQPQIVLLDVMMPVLNGFETAPKLKQLSGNLHLPIIFITALDAKETLSRCLQVGGDDFLTIPFEPVVLQAKINAHARVRELSYSLAEKNKALNWHSNRMEREQAVVQHMLKNALTENSLEQPFVQTLLSPVSTFNGDLCLGKEGLFGNYYVFLGDFTGHGLAPATGTLPISQAFFSMATRGLSVSDMAAEFNERLFNLLPDDMFCAALIIEFSPEGERLTCWNGGIPDALVLDKNGAIEYRIKSRHMALGILPPAEFDNQVEHLFVGNDHHVVAFTDGVVEMSLGNGELLGEQGFTRMVCNAWRLYGEQAFPRVQEQLLQLIQASPTERDDLSLISIGCQREKPLYAMTELHQNHLPFTLTVNIGRRELLQLDPVQKLVESLSKMEGLRPHKTTLYLLFAECFNNILDHNVLQLDSEMKNRVGFERYYQERQRRLENTTDAEITIEITYAPEQKRLAFELSSNGNCPYIGTPQQAVSDEELLYGRGLQLVDNLAERVEWRNDGQCLYVEYDLNRLPV